MKREPFIASRVLVTGGAGFVGSALARELLASRDVERVVVLDLLTYAGHRQNLDEIAIDPRFFFVHGDIADAALAERLFAEHGFDAVFHLAAESHVDRSIADGAPFVRTNVVGTFMLIEAARRAWECVTSARRFVHVSTDEVYGSLGTTGLFSEESPYAPNSPYAASKAAADFFVRAHTRTHGFPAIITHSSNNYGPRQLPEKLVPRTVCAAIRGEPLPLYGNGEHVREWLFVDDHVRGLLLALAHGEVGEHYGFGGGVEKPNRETVEAIADSVDAALGRPAGTSRAGIVSVRDRKGHDFRYALDSAKAKRTLGWAPLVDYDQGLARTVRWYIENPTWIATRTAMTIAPKDETESA